MSRLLEQKKNGKFPFEWTPSHSTDVRKTFERIREQQKQKAVQPKPKRA